MLQILSSWQTYPIYFGIVTWPFYKTVSISSYVLGGLLVYLFPMPSYPKPSGPHQVSSFDDEITTNRSLFWNNEAEKRSIYYKVVYPSQLAPDTAKKEPLVGYFEERIQFIMNDLLKLPFNIFSYAKTATNHIYENQPILKPQSKYPLVILSHGLTGTYDSHLSLVQSIASHGYVVAVLDHIGCATIAYLPKSGKRYKYMAKLEGISLDEAFKKRQEHVKIRVDDIKDVIQRITKDNQDLNNVLYGKVNLNSIHIIGHSLGGCTALEIELPNIKSITVLDAWTFPLSTSKILQPPLRHSLAIQAHQWFYKGDDFGKYNDADIYHYFRHVAYPLTVEKESRNERVRTIYDSIQPSSSESGYKSYLVKIPMGHMDPADVKFIMNYRLLKLLGLYKSTVSPNELHAYFDRAIVGFLNGVVNNSFAGLEQDLLTLQGSELESFE
eukprot:NODE_31_length_37178_cov_0.413576.p8 type:complete len:440 gc:universal NODE_31_length_37178_cov_0.413576:28044-29363(+)